MCHNLCVIIYTDPAPLAIHFRSPPPASVAQAVGQTTASAYTLIADFERLGILREITGSRWGWQYEFAEYFRVFE